MRVEFVLPRSFADYPIGGYAVVYQYANRLAARGHEVRVQHVVNRYPSVFERRYRAIRRRWTEKGPHLARWFTFNPAVQLISRDQIDAGACRRADAVIATAWQTAQELGRIGIGLRNGFYLLQHYETWAGDPAVVDATWRLPLTHLAIAHWLVDLSEHLAPELPRFHVPNGIDPAEMFVERPPGERDPKAVGMLWHDAAWKGSATGLAAWSAARMIIEGLTLTVFSAFPRPEGIDEAITWLHQPSRERLRRFYNDTAVFVSPSLSEGWGLPATEAMACGAALVSSDIPAVRDYADDTDSVLFRPGDADDLTRVLVDLVADVPRRTALAEAGASRIHQDFTWDVATDRFEEALITAT